MTSTRGAAFARWWSRRYTRGLPVDVRDRRIAEIDSDVHEQSCAVSGDRPSARAIAWRTARGIPADLIWRRQERRAMRRAVVAVKGSRVRNVWAMTTQAWFAPLAVLVGVFDIVGAIAIALERRDDAGSDRRPDRHDRVRGRDVHRPVAAVADRPRRRNPRRRGRRCRIHGTLPALALFWMVVPALVALAVIGGVLSTRPGFHYVRPPQA